MAHLNKINVTEMLKRKKKQVSVNNTKDILSYTLNITIHILHRQHRHGTGLTHSRFGCNIKKYYVVNGIVLNFIVNSFLSTFLSHLSECMYLRPKFS